MSEFNELREQLRRTRAARDAAARDFAAAREQLKRIEEREAALGRSFNPQDRGSVEARNRLREEKERAESVARRHRDARNAAIAGEAGAVKDFAIFTDPRESISRLNDSTPILLMPVRLETRFKRVNVPGTPAGMPQLWVRIFPDDCWIDSFDAALTDTEARNAGTYWTALWQAGGVTDPERGAWRALATSHGSGRAAWIISQFQPLNIAAKPTKPRPEDVILTIATQTALSAAEETAAIAYWRAAWLADGDAQELGLAFDTLVTAVGEGRAEEIVAQYVPANFDAPLAQGVTRDQVNVSVAFVVLSTVPTRQSSWASAPKMNLLPDRFVFIGYRGTDAPLVALGNPVPSPLIVAPDPSAPPEDQLQHDADGNLVMPEELRWMSDFERAIEVGMGLRINLTEVQARAGFDRVLVVGLRLNADAQAGQTELESLLRHHAFSRTGLAVVPQGTPTNNTEQVGSGHGRLDDPDATFDDRQQPLFTPHSDWLEKRDGQWVAEYLGIDPKLFEHVQGADSRDQSMARAMTSALWPATLGYWMETMMAPVFDRDAIEQTRAFCRP